MTAPLLELSNIVKEYGALRPLRIQGLSVAAAERVAIVRLDRPAAETLVNLITGATLPDAGEVRAFGASTASIRDAAEWLRVVDRFGILSDRVVLLEGMSVLQNLALPFSLDIEPPPDDVRARAAALAAEVGLSGASLDMRVADMDGLSRIRVRLGRALALDPQLLLLEHASASVERQSTDALAAAVAEVTGARGIAALALSADESFAAAVATRVLTLDAATGRLDDRARRGWFTRRRV